MQITTAFREGFIWLLHRLRLKEKSAACRVSRKVDVVVNHSEDSWPWDGSLGGRQFNQRIYRWQFPSTGAAVIHDQAETATLERFPIQIFTERLGYRHAGNYIHKVSF